MSTFIIAEAGVNQNGSQDMAKRLIDIAAEAGADAVKFPDIPCRPCGQSPCSQGGSTRHVRPTKRKAELEMIRKLEFTEADHEMLIAHAKNSGNHLPFHALRFAKPADAHGTFWDGNRQDSFRRDHQCTVFAEIARSAKRVILSTGMSNLAEVEAALGTLAFGFTLPPGVTPSRDAFARTFASDAGQESLRGRVTLLHCTTEYPAPYAEVNLRAMDTLAAAFALPVGFSDHTQGIHIPVAAVARGARVLEKHYTLDRSLPGPDHKASLEPDELRQMVVAIREVEMALGDGVKRPSFAEWKNRDVARKSLVAARGDRRGEVFTAENLACKRPGTGISPMLLHDVLGRIATRAFSQDELIES